MITFSYANPSEPNTEVVVTFTNTENSATTTRNVMPVWFDPDPLVEGDEYFHEEATNSKFEALSITYDVLQDLQG